jgi:hypothetical protein
MSDSYKYPNTPITFQGSPQDLTGISMLGYYTVETTQRYVYGTRGLTWDGKVFKYCRSKGTLYAGYGAANTSNGDDNTVARLINSVTPAAIAIGDRKITVTIVATECYAGDGDLAEDELAGATMVLGHGTAGGTESRTIVGNTSEDGGGTITVWVEYPFAVTHAAGVACEIPLNPYAYLSKGNLQFNAFMCVPNIAVTTGYNFWGQTWGPCWCVPGGGDAPGDTALERNVVFVGDGSVNGAVTATIEAGNQLAGYIIEPSVSSTGAMPMVMLQLSI